MTSKIATIRKFIVAIAGLTIPFLNQMGVVLPEFLTAEWLNTILMATTPMLVYAIPNKPAPVHRDALAHPVAVILSILIAMSMLPGCASTKSAYQSADGLDETAFVVGQHYLAVLREANALRTSGTLSGSALENAQTIVRKTAPAIDRMKDAASVYQLARTAETEQELTEAISAAALLLSDLINAIRGDPVTSTSSTEQPSQLVAFTSEVAI